MDTKAATAITAAGRPRGRREDEVRRVLWVVPIVVLLWTGMAKDASAQAGEQGSITGTVSDAQGGALPG
jgi:hypothetical protein